MRRILVSVSLAASFLVGCAGAPTYDYAFDPNFRFTPPKTYAWYDDPGGSTHPVGQKLANNWGLYDMHGNAWEWCKDYQRTYTKEDSTDRVGNSGKERTIRGGSWVASAKYCRCADRVGIYYLSGYGDLKLVGFRVVARTP